ncbi:hypothetical protein NHJ13734_003457 [Beauveria thailandica]
MTRPGGGPPRRGHIKSRNGCETCKRRHIRCDEGFPQCANCTKHKSRCPYNDMQGSPDRAATPDEPDLMWTPQITTDITEWQRTRTFPFPFLGDYPVIEPQFYSVEDLRLIYHLASLYQQLAGMEANNLTLWTRHIPTLLRIGHTTPYVMHALLAFSATHITFLTDYRRVSTMAIEHRSIALSGLHTAIDTFSRETSDAILAASLVLSWQANDWLSWHQLMQGTFTVISAIDSWKYESQFTDFIAKNYTIYALQAAPALPEAQHCRSEPRTVDLDNAFQRTLDQVQKVEAHLRCNNEETIQIQHLVGLLTGARKTSTLPITQQYESLQPLRSWLFWMPVGYLQKHSASANSLVVVAYFYTVALLLECLLPEIGAAHFASQSIFAVEEIAHRLMSTGAHDWARTHLALMQFPLDTVSECRSRMGLVNHEKTSSFPLYNSPTGEATGLAGNEPYSCNNSAYNYSAEEMRIKDRPPVNTCPLANQHYLNDPSPSVVIYPPVSSTLEGPLAYSEPEECPSFDPQTFQAVEMN